MHFLLAMSLRLVCTHSVDGCRSPDNGRCAVVCYSMGHSALEFHADWQRKQVWVLGLESTEFLASRLRGEGILEERNKYLREGTWGGMDEACAGYTPTV